MSQVHVHVNMCTWMPLQSSYEYAREALRSSAKLCEALRSSAKFALPCTACSLSGRASRGRALAQDPSSSDAELGDASSSSSDFRESTRPNPHSDAALCDAPRWGASSAHGCPHFTRRTLDWIGAAAAPGSGRGSGSGSGLRSRSIGSARPLRHPRGRLVFDLSARPRHSRRRRTRAHSRRPRSTARPALGVGVRVGVG